MLLNYDTGKKGNNGEVYKVLKEGSFFGEIALLTKLKRTATLISSDYTNCAYLNS